MTFIPTRGALTKLRMGSREKKMVILGPTGAGKATITGCMLFKYGGIDMLTMQMLEGEGIQKRNRTHHVTILDASAVQADCTILVLPADSPASVEFPKDLFGAANQLIIVINKMDAINWSEEQFQKIVEGLGYDTENVPIIPISALHGDNVVEKSPNAHWYKGWKKTGKSGTTLLEALDVSLQS